MHRRFVAAAINTIDQNQTRGDKVTDVKTPIFRRLASVLLALSAGAVMAHGDVTPQAVDTGALKQLGGEWVKSNPYRGDKTAIRIGDSAFNQNCARCHGLSAISGGIAPDLRYLPADGLADIHRKGRLRVAVYNDFPPYSFDGRGIDVEIGRALAERLGVAAEIAWFNADEDMSDDLRNMVWKGHYLGTQPVDVMLHVPLDPHLAAQNDKVRIVAPYHVEALALALALARIPSRVPEPSGSAAVALDSFTRERIGVEVASGPDAFLLSVLNGRLRENVVHYRSVALAVAGLRAGEVAAVMAPRAELESALKGERAYPLGVVGMPELRTAHWPLAMAVKRDNGPLAEALSGALLGLQQDGTVARIFNRYGITHQLPGE